MSINLGMSYEEHLRGTKPIFLERSFVHPPKGALGALTIIPRQMIPPINTNIQTNILTKFELSKHPGLSAIDHRTLPLKFNWREDGGSKSSLISKPGNQMLCGSCWDYSVCIIDYLFKQINNPNKWKNLMKI